MSRSQQWCALVLVLGVLVGCSDDPGDSANIAEPGAILTESDFSDTVRHVVLEAGNVRATVTDVSGTVTETVTFGDEPDVRVTRGQGLAAVERLTVDGVTYLRQGAGAYREIATEAPLVTPRLATDVLLHLVADNESALEEFEHEGSEEVDNQPFERYDLAFEPSWVAEVFGVDVVDRNEFSFWLDEEHRVRRLALQSDDRVWEADFTAWGSQPELTKPTEVEAADGYLPLTRDNLAAEVGAHFAEPVTVHVETSTSGDGDQVEIRGDLVRGPEGVIGFDLVYREANDHIQFVYADGRGYGRHTTAELYGAVPDTVVAEVLPLVTSLMDFGPGFDEGIDTVAYLGTTTVEGSEFRRYQVTIRDRWLGERVGLAGEDDPDTDAVFGLLLDDDHRYRRSWLDDEDGRLSHDLTDWRAPIDVEAPPSHLVVDPAAGA